MSISISMKLITSVFRTAIFKPLFLSIMLVFSGSLTCVMASSAVSPNMTISISSMLGYRTFNASALSPYSFGVSIDFPGAYLNKSDLYFGIIQPKSDSISTWVTADGISNLKDGLAPIVKGIDMETKFVFSLSSFLGQDIKYQFTESDPSGMYLIFALLVIADRTPFDTRNWVEVSIVPLFFNP